LAEGQWKVVSLQLHLGQMSRKELVMLFLRVYPVDLQILQRSALVTMLVPWHPPGCSLRLQSIAPVATIYMVEPAV